MSFSTLLGKDRTGCDIYNGDVVEHDNGIRPKGYFQIEEDNNKHGYVLVGVGVHKEGWLREWSSSKVRVLKGDERAKALSAQLDTNNPCKRCGHKGSNHYWSEEDEMRCGICGEFCEFESHSSS
ncbi:unnamed protein product [marine sediment metagenome]|uniref:Uncharacterized protein n=1 Tax=marine sediment metagenome TaxID=412755 RepID=X0SG58_9ZZZZ